jgi:hypothetical protein
VYSCGVAEENKGCDGDAGALRAARGIAKRDGGGALRRVARLQQTVLLRELRRFRKDQVTRRDSVARRATFVNWRLAAEHGSQMVWSVTTGVVSYRVLRSRCACGQLSG